MQASAVKLRGRVIDPRGGVAEIRTYVGSQALEGPEVRTDPSGAFELTLPDAAVVLVEASAADGRAATMRVLPVAGRIDVVAELPPNADEPETTSPIKLANVDSPAERVAQVVATYDTLRGQASPEHLVELAEMIEAETDGNVRQVLLVAYASLAFAPDETELREARLAAVDPAMVARLFAEVPATGFAWSLEWEALTLLDTTGHEPFVQKVAREHPDPDVRAALLAFMARSALEAGERDEARAMLSLANRTAPDSIFTAAVREAYPDLASSPASAAE